MEIILAQRQTNYSQMRQNGNVIIWVACQTISAKQQIRNKYTKENVRKKKTVSNRANGTKSNDRLRVKRQKIVSRAANFPLSEYCGFARREKIVCVWRCVLVVCIFIFFSIFPFFLLCFSLFVFILHTHIHQAPIGSHRISTHDEAFERARFPLIAV